MRLVFFILLAFSMACGPVRNNKAFEKLSYDDQKKYQKYLILGKDLYSTNCASCHQKDGRGLKKLIPPLAGSDYLQKYQIESAKLIRHGATQSIQVNGVPFTPTMPAHAHLSTLEIAEVLTYINNSWGNEYGFVDSNQVKDYLEEN